uniref:Uncharacterized protein n=1 Tax=Oryza glaberrima TaxID=4538 RepID=I1Q1J1_ORYGL
MTGWPPPPPLPHLSPLLLPCAPTSDSDHGDHDDDKDDRLSHDDDDHDDGPGRGPRMCEVLAWAKEKTPSVRNAWMIKEVDWGPN